jgi:hypothetical protein
VLLSWPTEDAAESLSPVVPMAVLDDFLSSQSLAIRIGTKPVTDGIPAPHMDSGQRYD